MANLYLSSLGGTVRVMNAADAYAHFMSNSGTDRTVDIAAVSVPARPWMFTALTDAVNAYAGVFGFTNVTSPTRDLGVPADGHFSDVWAYGNTRGQVDGRVTDNPSTGGATFVGTITMQADPYDGNLFREDGSFIERGSLATFMTAYLEFMDSTNRAEQYTTNFAGALHYEVVFDASGNLVLDESWVGADIGGERKWLRLDYYGENQSFVEAYLATYPYTSTQADDLDYQTLIAYLGPNGDDASSTAAGYANFLKDVINVSDLAAFLATTTINGPILEALYFIASSVGGAVQEYLVDNFFGTGGSGDGFEDGVQNPDDFRLQVDDVDVVTSIDRDERVVVDVTLENESGYTLEDQGYTVSLYWSTDDTLSADDQLLTSEDSSGPAQWLDNGERDRELAFTIRDTYQTGQYYLITHLTDENGNEFDQLLMDDLTYVTQIDYTSNFMGISVSDNAVSTEGGQRLEWTVTYDGDWRTGTLNDPTRFYYEIVNDETGEVVKSGRKTNSRVDPGETKTVHYTRPDYYVYTGDTSYTLRITGVENIDDAIVGATVSGVVYDDESAPEWAIAPFVAANQIVNQSGDFLYSLTAMNVGDAKVAATTYSLFLSTDEVLDQSDTELTLNFVPGFNTLSETEAGADEFEFSSVDMPAGVSNGDYYVIARINGDQVGSDGTKVIGEVTVIDDGPMLELGGFQYVRDHTRDDDDASIILAYFNVENNGTETSAARSNVIEFVWSEDDVYGNADDVYLGVLYSVERDADTSGWRAVNIPQSMLDPGSYNLFAHVYGPDAGQNDTAIIETLTITDSFDFV